MEKVCILHISDLHRDKENPISNNALISSLQRDLERYTSDSQHKIAHPNLIIVSGDIILGSTNKENPIAEITEQYEEAFDFLSDLAKHILHGDKSRIVIIPGNHDVTWKYSIDSLRRLEKDAYLDSDGDLIWRVLEQSKNPNSMIRWSWKDLSFYKIIDELSYHKRLEAFSNFYNKFYDGNLKYPLEPEKQFEIFDYSDLGISILALNSCFNNDHLNKSGSIHPNCIGESYRKLSQLKREGRLLLATWHHNTSGSPNDNDYMDNAFLYNLIDNGISLGFHGHQHKSQIIKQYNNVLEEEKLIVFSSGTLCGGVNEIPHGYKHQYNIVEISPNIENDELLNVTLHSREKTLKSPISNPIWAAGRIDSITDSSHSFFIKRPIEPKSNMALMEIEELVRKKDYERAILKLNKLDFKNPFVRKFLLECLSQTGQHDKIISKYNPPQNIAEGVTILNLAIAQNDKNLMQSLCKEAIFNNSPDPTIQHLLQKINGLVNG